MDEGFKKCTKCGEIKVIDRFSKNKNMKDGLSLWCKDCANDSRRVWYKNNIEKMRTINRTSYYKYREQRLEHRKTVKRSPMKYREYKMRSRYGIEIEEYDAMVEAQHGECAICHKSLGQKNLFIDHNHETGRIRGLLCRKCNTAIGFLYDSPDLLRIAADYLER